MKTFFSRVFIFLTLLLPMTLTYAAVETFTFDPMHTYVLWHINHFGFSNPSGKWLADGALVLDETNPQNSKVNVNIHITDMETGIPKLDEHLKTKDFFDIAAFPKASFVSNKIVITGKKTANVTGILTLHGVSKPITLAVTLNQLGVNPITNKKTAGFSGTTSLKRSEFGIDKYLPGLSDTVKVNLEAEATLS